MSDEPNFGKNYWLALILSMAVLLGYPLLLQKLNLRPNSPREIQKTTLPAETATNAAEPLSHPEGPFIEKPTAPTVIQYENENYEVEFSTLGASISRLVYKGETGLHGFTKTVFYEGEPAAPGLFGIKLSNEDADLTRTIFKLNRRGKRNEIFEFVYEKPGDYRLIKQYFFASEKPVIGLEIRVENLSPREKHFPIQLIYGLHYELGEGVIPHNFEAVVKTEKILSADLNKISKKGFSVSKDVEWAGVLKKYFAILVKPDWRIVSTEATADKNMIWTQMVMEPVTLDAGTGKITKQFFIFAGPQRYEILKDFQVGFEEILSRGFFGLFKIWLLIALKFLHRFAHNYGWAIILLTIGLKGLFTPLTHMSFQSMKKMQALQPKLKSIQERFKKDPAKLNREMMELYKRNRVNPMGGCLPMLLQIPIFIAFYQVLSETIELKGAPFIGWIHDLSQPDHLVMFPFTVPFIGNAFNLLPILMLISMFWQQKLTPQAGATPEQTKMMQYMPLIYGFLFYKMPSGLVLYWFVNNVLSIIHQIFVKRMVIVLHHEDSE